MNAVDVLFPGAVGTAANPVNLNPMAPLQIGPYERTRVTPLDRGVTRFAGHLGDFTGSQIMASIAGLAIQYSVVTLGVVAANMLQNLKLSTRQVLLAGGIAAGVALAGQHTAYGILGAIRNATK